MPKIELDELELLYIDDSIGCLRPNPFSEIDMLQMVSLRDLVPGAKVTAFPITILKIGGALLEIADSAQKSHNSEIQSVFIDFGEDELWMLRELADSNIRTKDRAVGYKLKLKVHRALRELIAEETLLDEELGIAGENSSIAPMSHDDVQNLMDKFQQQQQQQGQKDDASTGTTSN